MAIQFNTNSSIFASNQMGKTRGAIENHLEKLASGKRINGANDDAAGLAIMNEMDAQIRSLNQAQRNNMDGISMIQTADGAMAEMSDATIRMRELAIQSGNGTLGDEERTAINAEMDALKAEIDRIADTTEFSGQKLLDGSAGEIEFQVGVNGENSSQMSVDLTSSMDSTNLGAGSGTALRDVSAATAQGAIDSLAAIDAALKDISSKRSDLGAAQNQLASNQETLAQSRVSHMESKSRISDTDVAETTSRLAKEQILLQSSASVVAQANQIPNMALSLI